jgi:serine/threonine protein kinase
MRPLSTIAHYRITAKLGEGGMGEVWRATDTRLNRDVAIKILPDAFAQDADRLARFTREAQVLASLNHPNIAVIYGVEERALIMELVEGATLSERISQGAIAPEEALPIAGQIAEALEYAHERGIVHRDLKPANIKVTPDGRAKVLDFGLAKALSSETAAGSPASSPTLTMRATQVGVIMGTAAYMSPEQASGKPADRRADIWSFGAVLYEMLAGKRAFAGESVTETLASVLKGEPDWDALPSATPAPIRRLVRRCLTKDRRQRLQAIGEARIALESPGAEEAAQATVSSRSRLGVMAMGAAAVFFVIAAPLAFIHFREKPPSQDLVRFQIPAPERSGNPNYPVVSPNGRMIAFQATDRSVARSVLWVRSLDSLDARPLPGTENASTPFWSPDSRFLAFAQKDKLKRVELPGGTPQALCDVQGDWRGGGWSRDGVIAFGSVGHGLMRVSDAGGTATPLSALDPSRQEIFHSGAYFLPDGRHFLFQSVSRVAENSGFYVGSLDAQPEQQKSGRLGLGWGSVRYAASADPAWGYVLLLREGALMGQRFDNRRLQLAGDAVLIDGDLPRFGPPPYSASDTGVLAYTSSVSSLGQITWFARDGKKLGAVGEMGQHMGVVLSPDGARAAVSQVETARGFGNVDIWVHDFAHGTLDRLTYDPGRAWMPVWAPDGSRIAYTSNRGNAEIYQKASNGVGNEEVLLKSDEWKRPYDWSPDGHILLYGASLGSERIDLWYLPLAGDERKPRPYLQTEFSQSQARFSPDGRFVAYTSNETGRNEVYVRPFPQASGGKWPVSTNGGTEPHWRRDGKELYYISADSKMMVAGVTTIPAFNMLGNPKPLFTVPVLGGGATRYDVTADGQKFLIDAAGTDGDAPRRSSITVVLNWPALLKK